MCTLPAQVASVQPHIFSRGDIYDQGPSKDQDWDQDGKARKDLPVQSSSEVLSRFAGVPQNPQRRGT